MSGFCVDCGTALDSARQCQNRCPVRKHDPERLTDARALIRLPKAPIVRRLRSSGVEFSLILTAPLVLSILTFGMLDLVALPVVVAMVLLRDTQAGLFSIAKRVGRMRVVKSPAGETASNLQGVLRNCYYLPPLLLMGIPIIVVDVFAAAVFTWLLIIDVCMIRFRRDGRRMGDLLAGTQVVAEAKQEA